MVVAMARSSQTQALAVIAAFVSPAWLRDQPAPRVGGDSEPSVGLDHRQAQILTRAGAAVAPGGPEGATSSARQWSLGGEVTRVG